MRARTMHPYSPGIEAQMRTFYQEVLQIEPQSYRRPWKSRTAERVIVRDARTRTMQGQRA